MQADGVGDCPLDTLPALPHQQSDHLSSGRGVPLSSVAGDAVRGATVPAAGSARELRHASESRGSWGAYLVLALPLVCCGAPLVIALAAAAGTAFLGVVGGAVTLILGAGAFLLWRRRRTAREVARCCPPGGGDWSK